MECVGTRSVEHCACTYLRCKKRGNCCQCVAHHNGRGEIPGCFFTAAGEKSFDRSLANFIKDRGGA